MSRRVCVCFVISFFLFLGGGFYFRIIVFTAIGLFKGLGLFIGLFPLDNIFHFAPCHSLLQNDPKSWWRRCLALSFWGTARYQISPCCFLLTAQKKEEILQSFEGIPVNSSDSQLNQFLSILFKCRHVVCDLHTRWKQSVTHSFSFASLWAVFSLGTCRGNLEHDFVGCWFQLQCRRGDCAWPLCTFTSYH